MGYFFGPVLAILAVFLILLVLVQRGRGGGLTGALGGVGGSSAFGAKAGDVFTKITVVATTIWIAVCVAAAYWSGHRGDPLGSQNAVIAPPGDGQPSDQGAENVDPNTESADSLPVDEGTPDEGPALSPAGGDSPPAEATD